MNDCLKDQVGVLRVKLRDSGGDKSVYQELSDLLFQAGKIAAAINVLEKALIPSIGEDPSLPPVSGQNPMLMDPVRAEQESERAFDRGLEFADAFLYEDAVESFTQALEQGRDTFETHYCLAGVYKSIEKLRESEFHCRRSLTHNPRFAPGYILLGSLLKRPDGLEESVSACKKAVLIDPDCTAAYYDLACYYSLLSKCDQALAAMEMAFCKGFVDFDWLLRDPDLEPLRGNPGFQLLLQSYQPKNR